MYSIQSSADYPGLGSILNSAYPVRVDQVVLHREMIGYVYFAQGPSGKYVLKLHRSIERENALRAAGIIQYLMENGYPVVTIVTACSGERTISIQTPQGPCTAILYDFLEGPEPDFEKDITHIGRQVGWMHRLMQEYPQPLLRRGKDFYIDRFIAILRSLNYPPGRVEDLERYGSVLWANMQRLENGFCHGDLHSGNMIQTGSGGYVLFDFDAASWTYSVIDTATACNVSNFNGFDEAAYPQTLRRFERFYLGYCQEYTLNDLEIAAMMDFIAIRHYELIATITACQGMQILSRGFLDEQYDWLMRWKNLCDRNRHR